jgi:DNA primase large subunit
MVDLTVLAKFPFLADASAYIRTSGITLDALLRDPAYAGVRSLGSRRVMDSLQGDFLKPRDLTEEGAALAELLSYPVARMLVSCVPDPFLLRRYSIAEATLASTRLEAEPVGFLARVAEGLDIDLRREGDEFRVHYTDFLRDTRAFRDKKWKLVNRTVDRGYVVLNLQDFIRVLQNAIAGRMMDELPLPVNEAIMEAFKEQVEALKTQLALRRERFRPQEVGRLSSSALPPCMQRLLAAVQASENVPHMGRFALVAFLNNLRVPNEEIFRIFSNVPDFAMDVTRYQIEHITGRISGTEYTAPECSTMKSYGLCPGPDQLCQTITHPLNYYRKKVWRERRALREPPGEGREQKAVA